MLDEPSAGLCLSSGNFQRTYAPERTEINTKTSVTKKKYSLVIISNSED